MERLQDVAGGGHGHQRRATGQGRGQRKSQQLQFSAPSTNISIANPAADQLRHPGLRLQQSGSYRRLWHASVGIYIDGVYLDRPGMADFNLLDVDRVEVLRGPQGTLFGKNTTAGAISITTRGPTRTFEAEAQADVGNYGLTDFQGSVSGPITDQLSARISAYKTDRDGYLHDVATGAHNDSLHRQGVRGQLLYQPNSDFSLRLIGEYGDEDDSGGVLVLYNKGPLSSASPRYVPFDTWAGRLEEVAPVDNPDGLRGRPQ